MNLISRREPISNLPSILDRFWNEPFFANFLAVPSAGVDEGTLALDVSEDEKNVYVRASLPGFQREDVDVEVNDGVLTIKATHTEETEEKSERFYRKERRAGSLSRRLALPGVVLEGQTEAELKDGVLTLTLPKSPTATPKKVKIK